MGATAIEEVPIKEEIMNDEEFQEIVAQEVAGVGVGDFFDNMQELHMITYNKDMKSPDQDKWVEAIKEENNNMNNYKVFQSFPVQQVEKECKNLIIKMGHEEESKWCIQRKNNSKML